LVFMRLAIFQLLISQNSTWLYKVRGQTASYAR
jgi:hypothetical protein